MKRDEKIVNGEVFSDFALSNTETLVLLRLLLMISLISYLLNISFEFINF